MKLFKIHPLLISIYFFTVESICLYARLFDDRLICKLLYVQTLLVVQSIHFKIRADVVFLFL